MTQSNSPLRLLVKSYASGLLNRRQYLEIRQQLLKKLSIQGSISQDDLKNFLKIHTDTDEASLSANGYSPSDWIIILLGLFAAAALGVILYS